MICPTLKDLPPPLSGKTGWPWTEETPPLQDAMSKNLELPKISIVTPSYNQGQFLEETIRSVLLQGYHDLEYIIIDGGSTDNSVEIIRKYEPWLTYWVSEKDNGQSHAINKGWKMSTGEIIAYLNSDDTYKSGSVSYVAKYFQEHPEVDMVYSDIHIIDQQDKIIKPWSRKEFDLEKYITDYNYYIPQQGVFFRSSILEKVGFLDENLHFKMDRDFFIRIGKIGVVKRIPEYLANFRTHPSAKSIPKNEGRAWREFIQIRRRYGASFSPKLYFSHYSGLIKQKFLVNPLMKFTLGESLVNMIRDKNIKRELGLYEKRDNR
ncbi:MAG: glycosyltransferase family 2 protein [Thermodesulfobacteriota bacterium]